MECHLLFIDSHACLLMQQTNVSGAFTRTGTLRMPDTYALKLRYQADNKTENIAGALWREHVHGKKGGRDFREFVATGVRNLRKRHRKKTEANGEDDSGSEVLTDQDPDLMLLYEFDGWFAGFDFLKKLGE